MRQYAVGDRVQCFTGPLQGEMGIVESVGSHTIAFTNMDGNILVALRTETEPPAK